MITVALSIPDPGRARWWVRHLAALLPELDVRLAQDVSEPDQVRYAVVWMPPHGLLAQWPRLHATVSIGAGVDHVVADPDYPMHVPIVRTVGPDMTQRMREYVALHVLRFHRELPTLERDSTAGRWRPFVTPVAGQRRVGVLGMGHLGRAAALTLHALGFQVAGWSRSGGTPEGIEGFAKERLEAFLARSEILVCLLPLTADTDNLLDEERLAMLPAGARLINAARGAHLDERALSDALASGHVGGATLDVFRTEPLPAEHPFRSEPNVLVTPHLASLIDPDSGARVIAANLRRLEAGEPVADAVWAGEYR